MGSFSYIAINKKGERITAVMEARSSDEVANVLIENGLSPVKINEKIDFLNGISQVPVEKQTIPKKEKVTFYREFATMVGAGLPLDQALDISSTQTTNKGFQRVLNAIKVDVRGGSSLGISFAKFSKIFTPIETNLIKAGETSGTLDKVLDRLADDVENSQSLENKVRGALIYPAFVLGLAGIVIIVVTIKLVPAMKDLYSGFGVSTLPGPTEFLVTISDLLINDYVVIVAILIIIVVSFTFYRRTPSGKFAFDAFILKIPTFGDLIAKFELVKFIKTYVMLLNAGIPVINSLELVSVSLSNSQFAYAIAQCAKKVEKGVSLAVALSEHEVIPSILWKTIAIGEETGKTEEILTKIGRYFENEVNDKVNSLTRLIEPILLVVLGGAVGFIAVAIYLPIYNFATFIH